MSEAKHKCRSSSGVLKELELRIQNKKHHNHAEDNVVLWDNACYTKNDNYALNSWCFEERRETLEPWLFDGKVENPWLEARTKQVPELLVLEIEIKFF